MFIQDGIYDRFAEKLVEAVKKMKVAPGNETGSELGPLINDDAVAKVEAHVADAKAKGGTIATGGKRHALGGLFYEPTVILNATTEMRFTREETFGPVAPLYRFKTEAEAVELANASEFGLASYFFTSNLSRAWRVAEALESGIVGVNEGVISTEVAPFGGVKQSGVGREGSRYGVDDYMEIKYVLFGGLGK
jgi:succinate-semialdehyde dehydrogenase/glutarate-semialdehyde dehydrogenase